ncbi:MAG: hypothetical protein MZW92_38195 [Comamonadaceae bacterium]|nr:hypothetical protein [Comamonadaceae bacterium]
MRSACAWSIRAWGRAGSSGRATVPVLWDKGGRTVVNNESADILQILWKCGCTSRPATTRSRRSTRAAWCRSGRTRLPRRPER